MIKLFKVEPHPDPEVENAAREIENAAVQEVKDMFTWPFKRALCLLNVHWSGRTDGGMGDMVSCDICHTEHYGAAWPFQGIVIHDRSKQNDR